MNAATYHFKNATRRNSSIDSKSLMNACEILNQTDATEVYEQLIDYARHQLKNGTQHIKKLTLMGLSFMADHCSSRFFEALANPALMSVMKHLAVNHYSKKHRIFTNDVGLLSAQLIKEWFRYSGDSINQSVFSKTYERLIKKELTIPPRVLQRRTRYSVEEDVAFPKDVSESLKSASDTIELARSVMMQERRESEPAFQELLKGFIEELRSAKKKLADQTEVYVKNEMALFFLLESIDSIDGMLDQCKNSLAHQDKSLGQTKSDRESKPIDIKTKSRRFGDCHSLFGQDFCTMKQNDRHLYIDQQLHQEIDGYPIYDDNTLVLNDPDLSSSPLDPTIEYHPSPPSITYSRVKPASPSILYQTHHLSRGNSPIYSPSIQKQDLLSYPSLDQNPRQCSMYFLPSHPLPETSLQQSPWSPFTQVENSRCTVPSAFPCRPPPFDASQAAPLALPSRFARNPFLSPRISNDSMCSLSSRSTFDRSHERARDEFGN